MNVARQCMPANAQSVLMQIMASSMGSSPGIGHAASAFIRDWLKVNACSVRMLMCILLKMFVRIVVPAV